MSWFSHITYFTPCSMKHIKKYILKEIFKFFGSLKKKINRKQNTEENECDQPSSFGGVNQPEMEGCFYISNFTLSKTYAVENKNGVPLFSCIWTSVLYADWAFVQEYTWLTWKKTRNLILIFLNGLLRNRAFDMSGSTRLNNDETGSTFFDQILYLGCASEINSCFPFHQGSWQLHDDSLDTVSTAPSLRRKQLHTDGTTAQNVSMRRRVKTHLKRDREKWKLQVYFSFLWHPRTY